LIYAQIPDPSSNNHLMGDKLITISERHCRFMMHEIISSKGRYHQDSGHMEGNPTLCDWSSESHSKLRILKEHFEHYVAIWTSVMVTNRLVYELLSLSYCYTFIWCLMRCVPKCDLDWLSDEMCAWILSYPIATGR
jgi:hypothetical protein